MEQLECQQENRFFMEIPQGASEVIRVLETAGFEAFVVGGCVRDCILGKEPDDWDITTSATPEQVMALFRRTVATGVKHGTVTVLLQKETYEVTTYRIDGDYEDGRHPKEVSFTRNLADDLLRRDFTINAMAYSPSAGLVDLFGGMDDLDRKVIRCVGDAHARLTEDALRILRAVRFSAQLGFSIEEETFLAMKQLAGRLALISWERIQVELDKLLCSARPDMIHTAFTAGVTRMVLPEYDRQALDDEQQVLFWLKDSPRDHMVRWAALLAGVGESDARLALRRLRFDNDTVATVTRLVRFCDVPVERTMASLRKMVSQVGIACYPKLLALKMAKPDCDSDAVQWETDGFDRIMANNECVSLGQLAIDGTEVIALGVPRGKQVGEILVRLLNEVISHPEKNQYDVLAGLVKQWIR